MHELSIAESILSAIQAELDQRPGTHALKVGVRIGSMAAVDAGSLQFCFDSIVRDSEWEPLQLEIILAPAERLCNRCNEKFVVLDFNPVCPACGHEVTMALGGDELDLEYLELDEPETVAVEAAYELETQRGTGGER